MKIVGLESAYLPFVHIELEQIPLPQYLQSYLFIIIVIATPVAISEDLNFKK